MTILEHLRAETREIHNQLDQLPFMSKLLSGEGTVDDYVKYLQIFGAIHGKVESALFPVLNEGFEKYKKNSRISAIEKDLSYYDKQLPDFKLPQITIKEEGTPGALYVLEGSRLGGHYIAKQLKEKYEIPDQALHFLKEQPTYSWKEVRSDIEDCKTEQQQPIVSTAIKTFRFFEQCITLLMDRNEKDQAK